MTTRSPDFSHPSNGFRGIFTPHHKQRFKRSEEAVVADGKEYWIPRVGSDNEDIAVHDWSESAWSIAIPSGGSRPGHDSVPDPLFGGTRRLVPKANRCRALPMQVKTTRLAPSSHECGCARRQTFQGDLSRFT